MMNQLPGIMLYGMVWLGLSLSGFARANGSMLTRDVYVSGEGAYHTYRIPALVVTVKGTLLAFCEGRLTGQGDAGNIDILVKRSSDNGKTWSKQAVVWDDDGNTCGNPWRILDRHTGTLQLLMTWNDGPDHEQQIIDGTSLHTRKVFVTSSTDDGQTWAPADEITP